MSNLQFGGLIIGVPKEIMPGERRVAAIPETVAKFIAAGAKVIVESGAGAGAFFSDDAYREAGAQVVTDPEEVFAQANIIIKVKEPQFNTAKNKHEVEMMHSGQTLVTFLHPAAPGNHEMVTGLADRGVVSLTLDSIPRISRAQGMDALTSMSTVAGYKGVLTAAYRLAKFLPMIGTAVGMIQPANVFVIGVGVAGLQAVATAKRLGAVVYAADIRPDAQEQARSLGAKTIETGVPADVAMGQGGYARSLPEEWLVKEREIIKDTLPKTDILILSALVPGRRAPVLVTDAMVRSMAPGSAIVDIAIDQGGNCAITEGGKVTEKNGVSIDGTKNIPGTMPTSSTWMFARNIYNFVTNLVQDAQIKLNLEDEIIASSLVTRDGQIVHAGVLEAIQQ